MKTPLSPTVRLELSRRHRNECAALARAGDSGAADRLRACLVSRLVHRHGARRIGRFATVAAGVARSLRNA